MGDHLIDGEFQSDKYPTCPRGKVPLSVKDTTAQDLLWEYAQRRRAVDAEFAADLETALQSAGFVPVQDLVAQLYKRVRELESYRRTPNEMTAALQRAEGRELAALAELDEARADLAMCRDVAARAAFLTAELEATEVAVNDALEAAGSPAMETNPDPGAQQRWIEVPNGKRVHRLAAERDAALAKVDSLTLAVAAARSGETMAVDAANEARCAEAAARAKAWTAEARDDDLAMMVTTQGCAIAELLDAIRDTAQAAGIPDGTPEERVRAMGRAMATMSAYTDDDPVSANDRIEELERLLSEREALLERAETEARTLQSRIDNFMTFGHGGPIPMLIWCPMCKARHLDVGEFATKVHHTHTCQTCGLTWRPCVLPTVGVQFLPGFKNEEET